MYERVRIYKQQILIESLLFVPRKQVVERCVLWWIWSDRRTKNRFPCRDSIFEWSLGFYDDYHYFLFFSYLFENVLEFFMWTDRESRGRTRRGRGSIMLQNSCPGYTRLLFGFAREKWAEEWICRYENIFDGWLSWVILENKYFYSIAVYSFYFILSGNILKYFVFYTCG